MMPADPALLDTTPPFLVGRGREEAVLRGYLTAALGGHGSLVLIGGEAGIGKTALAEATCREAAEQGALVLVGRCYDLTETPPYGPWLDLLARHASHDDLPPLPAAFAQPGMMANVESQAALFQRVKGFLAAVAASRPLVLLLDDLHWADPASLDLLRYVARAIAPLPILLIVTYRADELTRPHPLNRLLPLLKRESPAARLTLRPLTGDAVRALIGTRYHLPEAETARLTAYLHQRAEGNAFFTTELLRALEEDDALRPAEGGGWALGDLARMPVPAPLRQVIDGRLARLGAGAQGVLAVAAVIGQAVPLDLWMTVTGADEEALSTIIEYAVAAHVMEEMPDGTHARFVHALIRETLYESILPSRRRRMHRRIGDAIADQVNADPDAVAYHFRQAGDARASAWLVSAGERAERAYAWMTAADRYAAAVALMDENGSDAVAHGWLLLRLGWLRRWGDPQGAIDYLERATHLVKDTDDPALSSCVTFVRGLLYCRIGNYRRGITDLRAAIGRLDALSEAETARFHALDMVAADFTAHRRWATLGMWLAFSGYYDEARTICEGTLTRAITSQHADESGSAMEYNARYGLGFVHAALGNPDEALEAFAQSSAVNRATGNLAGAAQAGLHALESVLLPYRADRPIELQRLATEIEETWMQTSGVLQNDNAPRFPHLLTLFLGGHWDEACELALAVRSERVPTRRHVLATRMLAIIARNQGNTALAWTLIQEGLPAGLQAIPGDIEFFPALILQRLAASLALDVDDFAAACEWLEVHDRWLTWNQSVLGQAEGHLGWAAYHRAVGDSARAYRHANQALAHASEPRQPLALLAAHRLLGELDTDAGRFDDAAAHLADALALADACAAPYERALTLLAQAELRAAAGSRADAMALLDEARAICTPLGAQPALARLAALAASLAAVAAPAPRYPDGMTAREGEVLRLIAAGMSNREMAARLSVSVRTIERHIENLYRKIGTRSKADATAYAFRHDLT